MSYIGRDIRTGAFRQPDDISSGFDGSDTTHTMQVNSTNVSVGDVNQILLSLGGVIQKPGTDFTVSGSTLTFTTAPAANTSFFAILLGSDNGGTVTPTDGSVTTGKIVDDAVTAAKVASSGAFAIGASGTASSIAGITFHRNGDDDGTSIYTADVSGTDNLARSNTGFGMTALDAITTGDNNAVFGYAAATALDSGVENTAIGRGAMQSATSASYNTCVGNNAGNALSSGDLYNVLVGHGAGLSITSGNRNIAIGVSAMDGFDTETHNLGIGVASIGGSVAGGEYNVAVGNYTFDALTSGDYNTAVGYNAGTDLTQAEASVLVGYGAGENITTGDHNVCIGYAAGDVITTGERNICIGGVTDPSGLNAEGTIVIGYNFASGGDNRVNIGSNLGYIYNSYTQNATWTQTSDERWKKNITTDTLGLDFINELRPVTFNWKKNSELDSTFKNSLLNKHMDKDDSVKIHGLIAQEVKAAMDKVSNTTFNGWADDADGQSISREMFITPLIKAVQELSAKVKALEEA